MINQTLDEATIFACLGKLPTMQNPKDRLVVDRIRAAIEELLPDGAEPPEVPAQAAEGNTVLHIETAGGQIALTITVAGGSVRGVEA